jgi:outer membrane protein
MRWLARAFPLLCALFCGSAAQAQFANHSISLSGGYQTFSGDQIVVGSGYPLTLGSTLYVEGGWEATADFAFLILNTAVQPRQQAIGIAPAVGMRYLLMQETLRPWLGLDVSYLHVFADVAASNFVGVGPKAGVDYFLTDTVSVGVRANYVFYLMLNAPLHRAAAANVVFSAWF